MKIEEGKWVLLEQPNERCRLVLLKRMDEVVCLGRFGSFKASELLGKTYDLTYEISKEGALHLISKTEEPSLNDKVDDMMHTNEHIFDTNTSQQLTDQDIVALKTSLSSNALIRALVENSSTFSGKNAFSKQKYIARKTRKFGRFVKPRPVTPASLVEHFGGLREDALAHVLFAMDTQDDGRYLIWDDYKGIWCGAVMHRCPQAEVIAVHEGLTFNSGHLAYLKLDDRNLLPLSIDAPIQPFEAKRDGVDLSQAQERHQRKLGKQARASEGLVDAILIAGRSEYNPADLLSLYQARLRSSGKLVVFSLHIELLSPLFEELCKNRGWIDVRLEECLLQPWQAHQGRLHPTMTASAHAGFILTSIKVVCD